MPSIRTTSLLVILAATTADLTHLGNDKCMCDVYDHFSHFTTCKITTERIPFARSARSLSNVRIPWTTRKLCFLILFAEDVDPDKVLRRYLGLDLEVKGFAKVAQGAFKCSLSLACEGVFSPIFHDAIFVFLHNSK
jgi:hypothetical protein